MAKTAFVGAKIFETDTEEFYDACLVSENGYITYIGNDIPDGCERVYLDGKYLIPGLIDVHTHGIAGHDFNTVDEEDIPAMCHRYAKLGTTSVMATLASDTVSHYVNSICAINQIRLNDKKSIANILGVHLEGRYLNPDMKGAHAPELLALPNEEEAELLASTMMPPPMHFSLAPELEGAHGFIKKACELGATVGIAHTNATYEEAREAIELGARSFTHTFNAMTKLHHRMPGATACSLVSDDAYSEIIPDGQHVHPAMVKLAYKSKPKDKLVLITDSLAATDQPEGEYNVAGSPFYVKDGLARLADGTIAGSTLTMFGALKNIMKFADISLNEAIKYVTVNPASMVKANGVGRLEKCYRADFIVLDNIDNIEIDTVYVGGVEVK